MMVDYGRLTPLLVNAIQELQDKYDDLRDNFLDLKKENLELKRQMDSLD
jgi:hypothetical protein